MIDCLQPDQLKHLLSQFPNLSNVEVTGQVPVILTKTAPVILKGIIMVHGQHYQYEMEVDLLAVKNADHVLQLVEGLNKAFEAVAKRGPAVPQLH